MAKNEDFNFDSFDSDGFDDDFDSGGSDDSSNDFGGFGGFDSGDSDDADSDFGSFNQDNEAGGFTSGNNTGNNDTGLIGKIKKATAQPTMSSENRGKFAKTGILLIVGGVIAIMLAFFLVSSIINAKSRGNTQPVKKQQKVVSQTGNQSNTAQSNSGASTGGWETLSLTASDVGVFVKKQSTFTVTRLLYEANVTDTSNGIFQVRIKALGNIAGEIGTYEMFLPADYIGNAAIKEGISFNVSYKKSKSNKNYSFICDIEPTGGN